jgi:hypothetical protein
MYVRHTFSSAVSYVCIFTHIDISPFPYAILGFAKENYLYGSSDPAAGLEFQLWSGFNNRLTKTTFCYVHMFFV